MVPEGWSDATLGDLVRLQRGHDLPAQDRVPGDIEVIGGGGPNGTHNVARANAPGIVIGRSGSGIGNAWWSDRPYWPLNTGLYVTDFMGNDPRFCFLWMDWIDFRSHNSGGAQPSLNRNFIYPIPIPLPPLSEQRKIAEILSTWDRAIDTTEKLLENARAQKRALMQSLLTGKRRFPEFEGQPWREVRLGDIGSTFTGLTGKTKDDFGEGSAYVPYLNIFQNSRIDTRQFDYVRVEKGERQNRLKFGDILFTTSSETPDEVGMPSVLLDDVPELFLNSFCFGFRLHTNDDLRPRYARFYLRGTAFRRVVRRLAQGATRYNLSKTYLLDLRITLPPVDEQDQIANVLEAAELEERALLDEAKRLRIEKKALMQQLLTGKRRVRV